MTALASGATQSELSLPNAVGELDSGNRHGSPVERLQAVHGRAASLDGTMILLDDIVEVLAGAYL